MFKSAFATSLLLVFATTTMAQAPTTISASATFTAAPSAPTAPPSTATPMLQDCWHSTVLDGAPASMPVDSSSVSAVGGVCVQPTSTDAQGNVLFQTVTFPAPGASSTSGAGVVSSRSDYGVKVILPAVLGAVLCVGLIVGGLLWFGFSRRAMRRNADTKEKRWAQLNFEKDADTLSQNDIEKGVAAQAHAVPPRSGSLPLS